MNGTVRASVVVEIVVLLAAVGLTVAYFFFNLTRSDRGLTLILIALWVLVAALAPIALSRKNETREEIIRRFYLSEEGIYNHEIGYASFDRAVSSNDAYEFVSFAADSLAEMSYGFEDVDPPDDFKPIFVISTYPFHCHKPEDAEEDDGAITDSWQGALLSVEDPEDESTYKELGTYGDARELAVLLEENGVFL